MNRVLKYYSILLLFFLHYPFGFLLAQLPAQQNLILRLDPAQGMTTSPGALVSQWQDLDRGVTLTQSNDIRKPVFFATDTQFNNQPFVLFGGNLAFNTSMSILDFQTPFTDLDSFTLIFLHQRLSASSPSNQYFIGTSTQGFTIGGTGYSTTLAWDGIHELYATYSPSSKLKALCITNHRIYENGNDVTTSNTTLSNVVVDRIGMSQFAGSSLYFYGKVFEFIIYNKNLTTQELDSVMTYIQEKYTPAVNLGPDRTNSVCNTISAYKPWLTNYVWSTGDTDSILSISDPGTYMVTATDLFGNQSSDTINISLPFVLNFNPIENFYCQNDSVLLSVSIDTSLFDIIWSTGQVSSDIYVNIPSNIQLTITDTFFCTWSTVPTQVTLDSIFTVNLIESTDTVLCRGSLISSTPQNIPFSSSYLWSTGDTSVFLSVDSSDTYLLTITNTNGCSSIDSIHVLINGSVPITSFNVLDSMVCVDESIDFINTSFSNDTNTITSFIWNFGFNNETSFAASPSFSYSQSGVYLVNLTAFIGNNCSASIEKTMIVNSKPQSSFTINGGNICSDKMVLFTNTSIEGGGGLSSIFWDFGFNFSDTIPNPSYSYPNAGTYPVTLVVGNSFGCKDTAIQNILVQASPQADFIVDSSCVLTSVQFSDNSLGSIVQRSWNFGNGSISSDTNPQTMYNLSGSYPVSLSVLDLNGCSDDTSNMLSIRPVPSVDYLLTSLCENRESVIQNTSTSLNGDILSVEWGATLNNNQWTSVLDSFNFTPQESGVLVLTMQILDIAGCSAQRIDTIIVNQTPQADFTISPMYGNPPLVVNLENESSDFDSVFWMIDTLYSQNQNISYLFSDTGNFLINLLVTNTSGCSDSIQKSIQIGNLKYDIALSDLKVLLDSQADQLTVSVRLSNQGNIPIYNYALSLNLYENIYDISEIGSQPNGLFPKDTIEYVFNSKVQLQNGVFPKNICATAKISDIEINLLNNEFCQSYEEQFYISRVYPNPASNQASLEFFSDESTELTILLYDAIGNVVVKQTITAMVGLNRHMLSFLNIKKGMYILELQKREQSEFIQLEILP